MIEREIKSFVLKALLAAGNPMTDDTLKGAITTAFQHVALPSADLTSYIKACESAGMISGTNDELLGVVWGLTTKGKLRAQQLR
jgi:hypothetical protein